MAGHGILKRLPSSSRGPKIAAAATDWLHKDMVEWEDQFERHDVRAVSFDDPIDMTIVVGVRCGKCVSMVRGSVPFSSEDLDQAVVDEFRSVLSKFKSSFYPSCEDSRRMNLVRDVMES